jgi:tRNA modification GTPase
LERTTCGTQGAEQEGLKPQSRGVFEGQFNDGLGTCPVLVIWMPGPGSYTREDVVEFHLPGNPHLMQAALQRLLKLGARSAEPGEFTRRAFENGALDLTRAEGVLALIESANDEQRRAASALLLGGLGRRMAGLRECLDDLRSLLEASLDFDQNDTGHVPEEELEALFQRALEKLQSATLWESARDAGPDLQRVVLAGAPNAGKSSLYNALMSCAPDPLPALVDPLAGSTRDVRRGELSVGYGRVTLIDTAGVGPLQDSGEALCATLDARAQERARQEVQAADLVLWVLDGGAEVPARLDPPGLLVWNQIDRPGVSQEPPAGLIGGARGWCAVSAQEGQGLESLRKVVAGLLGFAPPASGAGPRSSDGGSLGRQLRARHLDALRSAKQALAEAHQLKAQAAPLDLVAEALRGVSLELDAIEGSSTSEDLLDRIFSRFCLGK